MKQSIGFYYFNQYVPTTADYVRFCSKSDFQSLFKNTDSLHIY